MKLLAILLSIVIIPSNVTPSAREIGARYHVTLNQSEVWMNLEPKGSEPGPSPFVLNFTVKFPGPRTDRGPDTIMVRAIDSCSTFPTRIRRPIFRFVVDGRPVDLGSSDHLFQFVEGCSETSVMSNAVVANISSALARVIASARNVRVEALGFAASLSLDDLTALRHYLQQVSEGVVVKN
jgi:hypothetical protein